MSEHTPTPALTLDFNDRPILIQQGDDTVALFVGQQQDLARLIVRAVNNHERLVNVCRGLVHASTSKMGTVYELQRLLPEARAALAQVEEES